MKLLPIASFFSLACLFVACAEPVGSDEGDGSGGATGGTSDGSGGLIGASGGNTSTGGGVSTGGAGTGGASTGGGTSTGGAGTGGAPFDGQCAGKPAMSAWKTGSSQATGDQAVFTCVDHQSECAGATVGEPALFECVDTHVGNCVSQDPRGGTAWNFLGDCSDTGMAGGSSL